MSTTACCEGGSHDDADGSSRVFLGDAEHLLGNAFRDSSLTTDALPQTIMCMGIIRSMAAIICFGAMLVAQAAGDPRVEAVLEADDARIAAMTAADPVTLAPLLSPDLRYSHSNGAVDTKSSLLELIGGKTTRYVSYRTVERGVRFATPEIALEHGRAELVLEKDGKQMEATLFFLAVWRLEDGAWRFLEWQSARLR